MLGMMYHCIKISEQISGKSPHVVLATDEITFVYIKLAFLNKFFQRLYRFVGNLSQHIMFSRNDPNSSFVLALILPDYCEINLLSSWLVRGIRVTISGNMLIF